MADIFVHAIDRPIDVAIKRLRGERPSVRSTFGAVGDGSVSDKTAFANSLDDVNNAGGGIIYVPAGTYDLEGGLDLPDNVELNGDGPGTTFLKRTSNAAAGKGFLDLAGVQHVAIRNLTLDLEATTPTDIDMSAIGGDPLHNLLTLNTAIWAHSGCKRITLDNVRIRHTGGYAFIGDARTVDVEELLLYRTWLENCRPHRFGLTSGATDVPPWTGGILLHGNGQTGQPYMVRGAKIIEPRFERVNGNAFWTHLYGFGSRHWDIQVSDVSAIDIGRDLIQFGGVAGGSISQVAGRRIGYQTTDDSSAAVPLWKNGQYAVGIDMSGEVTDVDISDVSLISCNGAYMDLDGLADSAITNVTLRTPRSTDIEYADDGIGVVGWGGSSTAGRDWAYGIQTNNTSGLKGGAGLIFSNVNLINLSGGGFRGYGARNCKLSGITIEHPSLPNVAPIVLGNIGTGAAQRAYGNVLDDIRIAYDPSTAQPCIWEDANGSAFDASDKNWIGRITVLAPSGKAFVFQKDANTASTTRATFATNYPSASVGSDHYLQREGRASDSTSALRIYLREGTSEWQHAQLQGYWKSGSRGPLFNVSEPGGSKGVISTYSTTSAFEHAVLTGKVYLDGFLAMTDTAYSDSEANLMGSDVALLRWNNSLGKWRQSIAVSSGVRVWSDLATNLVAGSDKQVQFNDGGNFGASANFAFDKTLQKLTITGISSTAALVVSTGYIQTNAGLLTNVDNYQAINSLTDGAILRGYGLAPTAANKGGYIDLAILGYANYPAPLTGLSSFGSTDVLLWASGTNGTSSPNTTYGLMTNACIDAAAGLKTSAANYNAIQAPSGGIYASLFTVDTGLYPKALGAGASPANPGTGYGGLAYRTGSLYAYWNGSAWAEVNLSLVSTNYWSRSGTTLSPVTAGDSIATSGLFNSTATGGSLCFQGGGGNFQVDGNGNISGAGVLHMAGSGVSYTTGGLGVGVTSLVAASIFQTKAGTNANFGVGPQVGLSGSVCLSAFNDAGSANTPLEVRASKTVWTTGSVGIQIDPSYTLDVSGTFRASSTATFSGTLSVGTTVVGGMSMVVSGFANQLLIGPDAPLVMLSNNLTASSRTQAARFVMASAPGHFGPFAAGDAWLFTEGVNGGTAGDLYIGANSLLALKFNGAGLATFNYNVAIAGAITGVTSITASSTIQSTVTGASVAFQAGGGNFQAFGNGNINGASINALTAFQINGTTVISSARAGTFTGLVVSAGNFQVDSSGNVSMVGTLALTGTASGVNVSGSSGASINYNAIQVSGGGGMYARSITALRYIQAGNNSGVPSVTTGDSFNAGAIYYDTGSSLLRYFDGASWNSISATSTNYWSRSGTTLSPVTAGDNIATSGLLQLDRDRGEFVLPGGRRELPSLWQRQHQRRFDQRSDGLPDQRNDGYFLGARWNVYRASRERRKFSGRFLGQRFDGGDARVDGHREWCERKRVFRRFDQL